ERQLEATRERTGEKQLKERMAKQRLQRKKGVAALREARSQLKQLEGREARLGKELPEVRKRLETLQERYAKVLSENKTLKFRSRHVPADVTAMAREHERLLKDLADTHYNMGVLFTRNGDYNRAAAEFLKAVELKPKDADAHYNLGLIYAEHLSDPDKAMTYFRRYLDINPRARDASWVKQYIASRRAWEGEEHLE
ncbi:MAG: tetratricopeptide repeat protein, partial [Chloroflexi bacterium]|nr:tetratricopeptide repeat protein [Chloroflexota bacterium]